MLVREAMLKNVPTIRVDKKLAAARSIMDWAHLNHLPVVDGEGHYVGVLTRESIQGAIPQDATIPRAERDRKLGSTPVSNAIIPDAPCVTTESRVWHAAQLMSEHGVTGLPVVEGDQVKGLVTASHLVAMLQRHHLAQPKDVIVPA